jgi:hypothetical protein
MMSRFSVILSTVEYDEYYIDTEHMEYPCLNGLNGLLMVLMA